MKKFRPYDIIHINLYEPKNLLLPAKDNNGKYILIWWKEIALGQFFIDPETVFDDKEYKAQIVSTIIDTIEFYEKKINGVSIGWETWLLNHNPEDWQNKLQYIFEPFIYQKYPRTVSVSVIICTCNRPVWLNECLEFLKKSITMPEEIIVVDNAPENNDTYDIVNKFKNVAYVKEPRKGLSFARNAGIKKANAPIIAFTDDDVQVHSLWVYRLSEIFQNDKIAAMTGLVITSELETEAQYIFEKHWSFNRGFVEKIYGTNYFESALRKGPPVWEIGAGANMAFRKSIIDAVGYFNEFLGAGASGCSEDSEMWFRILAEGYEIKYDPKAITFHKHRKDMKSLKKQIFQYMRGFTVAALMQQKQFPPAAYKRHIFINLPRYYFALIKKGFPYYRAQYQTLSSEMKGILSGLRYYYKNFYKLMNSSRK